MAFSRSHLITYILLVFIPYAASITFYLTTIGSENDIDIATEADSTYISFSDIIRIQVTPDGIGSGRVTYIRPFHLWDNRSNKLESFSINFTFLIDSNDASIGIRISSLVSVRHQKWVKNITGGRECRDWITHKVGLVVAVAFFTVLAFVLCSWKYIFLKYEDKELGFDHIDMNDVFEMGIRPTRFSYHRLARLTGEVSENEKLGEGGFVGFNRGTLKYPNLYIPVKRVSKSSKQGYLRFLHYNYQKQQGLRIFYHVSKIMVALTYFLLLFIPHASSITFNFTNIGPEHLSKDINIIGDGYISDDGIHVTLDGNRAARKYREGRATYSQPLHLWDNMSGELASFTTYFSFVIDSESNAYYGDGLTFFLAENNSMMLAASSMGLPITLNDSLSTHPFVAVEFDTYANWEWDPRNSSNDLVGDHVGISISSHKSVASQKWFSNIVGGGVCQAWITYDSLSKNFSVSFTGFQNNTVVRQEIHYIIDLKAVLPEWVIFGFSAATGRTFQKNIVKSWAFNSSDLQIDATKQKNSKVLEVRLIVGLSVLITFLTLFAFCEWRKKISREENKGFDVGMNNDFERSTGPKKFSYRDLAQSTNDFAEDQKLGEGGFGGVYKGFLQKLGSHVAVKRVSKSSKQGIKEYASEVKIISRLRHRNLVQLTGWCHEKGELLLVYEFMENGSLDLHLFKAKSLLTWGTRYKIAHGLASSLLYLHEEWEQCVLHRDIKSSNVMLDSNFNTKLGDFGLAKLVDHEKGSHTTMLAGTLGYMAPEYVVTGKATKESDVFSFGVVALEIACGRKPIEYKAPEKQIRLVQWVWELYGTGTLLEAVDPRLGFDIDIEEIKRLMILGLWCVHPDSDFRPSMRQAVQVLNYEAFVPILPSKMPVASYFSSPMTSSYGDASIIQTQSLSNTFYMGRS